MREAIRLAERARGRTAPNPMVGSVVVRGGRVIARGFHRRAGLAHAEASALARAGARARGATLYVTLEPCDMCVGAMFHARIRRAVYGAKDPKKLVLKNPVKIEGGVLAQECGSMLTQFFAAKR